MSRKEEGIKKLAAVCDRLDEAVNDGLRKMVEDLGIVIWELESEPEPEDHAPDFDGEEYSRVVYIADEDYALRGEDGVCRVTLSDHAIMEDDRAYVLREEADANVQSWKEENQELRGDGTCVWSDVLEDLGRVQGENRELARENQGLREDVDALWVANRALRDDLDREYHMRMDAERELMAEQERTSRLESFLRPSRTPESAAQAPRVFSPV